MPDSTPFIYIWRCAKCSNHFANISKVEGILKLDKKCPKCKSQNQLTLTSKEIYIHCTYFDQGTNGYGPVVQERYPYPDYPPD